jgi:perosamine synthetase
MDADPETWQMDVNKVEKFLARECTIKGSTCYNKRTGRRIRAILPAHILGLACAMDRIVELAQEHGLKVVEDAAEGMGVRFSDRHVGTFGDIGVFSFNGNKIITTGGGGMLVTNNSACADYARYLSTQAKDDEQEYLHNEVGYNYRLTNIQAALGIAQLEQIDNFIARKRAIARAYEKAFSDLPGLTSMPSPANCEPTYWLYTILLGKETTLEERKAFIRGLNERGVGARPLWHTIHDLPPYRSSQAYQIQHSVRMYERGVSLPSGVGLSAEDQQKCIEVLKAILVK